jgi:hypothetical protein
MTTPSRTRELALHRLDPRQRADRLDPWLYSSYKYGSLRATAQLADALADELLAAAPDLATERRLVLAASPYRHVPTAAAALARAVHRRLADARASADLPAAPLIRIAWLAATSGDCATLSAADREAAVAHNRLSFDPLGLPGAEGTHLIVIDDVRITGAHQRALIRASDALPLGSRTFVHLGAVDEPGAPGDPGLEDRLNHARIKTLSDLAQLLAEPNRAELPGFLAERTVPFLREAHRYATLDGYDAMPAYRASYRLLEEELEHCAHFQNPAPLRKAIPA